MQGAPSPRDRDSWQASRDERFPRLAWELRPWLADFLDNLWEFFTPIPPLLLNCEPTEFWPDVFVNERLPWQSLARSSFWHISAVAIIVFVGSSSLRHHAVVDNPLTTATITYYKVSEYLPQMQTPLPKVSRREAKPDPSYAVQNILSVRSNADNSQQTIVHPPTPLTITHPVALPNLVAWTPVPQAPPVAALHASRFTLPNIALPVVEPQPEIDQASSKLRLPMMPRMEVIAPPSDLRDLHRVLSNVNVTPLRTEVEIAEPRLPVLAARTIPNPGADEVIPPPPSVSSPGIALRAAGQLVSLSVAPPPPAASIEAPAGSRDGTFEADPTGRSTASGTPRAAPGNANAKDVNSKSVNSENMNSKNGASRASRSAILLDGISISGGAPTKESVVAGRPSGQTSAASRPHSLTEIPKPVASVNSYTQRSPLEEKIFDRRKSYSMIISMPNLTSAGGSWLIHFAERDPDADKSSVTAPVALNKVDPGYPADLIHDGIEGTVTLYAVIRSDGSVSDVKVLDGFNDRLDASATRALGRWHFLPATKNGEPVDLVAVVQIPFRARKLPN